MDTRKLAVVLPGIGYNTERPLLYYGQKLLREAGYTDILKVDYYLPGESRIPVDMEGHRAEAIEVLYDRAIASLGNIDWGSYDEIFFLSKSVGAAIAALMAERNGLNGKARHVLFTPLIEAFDHKPQNAIGFIGDADSWSNVDDLLKIAGEQGIKMCVFEDANHSLETRDTLHNIDTIKDVMTTVAEFISLDPRC